MAVSISKILDNSELSLKQFSEEAIKALEARIQEKDLGEGVKPYAQCVIRDKEIMMKPEEIVRQLFAEKLMNELQNEIASLVGQSLECKQQSRLLQQSAIQMVEEVIEKYRVN